MSEGAHHTPARRAVVRAAGAAVLASALAGCWPFQRRMTQNFRITIEDEFGLKLGSGVWRYEENVPQQHLSVYAGWDGEAFPIVHPTRGKMYVVKGGNSGWRLMGGGDIKRLYQQAGLMPADDVKGDLGAEGFRHIAGIRQRIELPLEHTPGIVQFSNDQDRMTMRLVTTYSKRKPAEVILRFFVVPTDERMTTGILKHLPWLPSRAGKYILGEFGKLDRSQDQDGTDISPVDFLDNMTNQRFMSDNIAKAKRQ